MLALDAQFVMYSYKNLSTVEKVLEIEPLMVA